MVIKQVLTASVTVALLSWIGPASADPKGGGSSAKMFESPPEVLRGWYGRAQVAATFNLSDHEAVVGQQDGMALSVGYKVDTETGYEGRAHEWRNRMQVVQGLARTPTLPQFVKSQDALRIESIYLFRATPWFGPYLRAVLSTAVLRGHDIRNSETTYIVKRLDGSTDTRIGRSLALTDMLRPLVLCQSAGPYARAVRTIPLNLETRVGFAGRETLAAKQLAMQDDDATPTIEIKELENQQQAGPDAGLSLWGKLSGERVQYRVDVEVMVPVLRHPDTKLGQTALDLTNVDLLGSLNVKLAQFASLDYQLKIARQPQLLDETQFSHLVTLTFGVSTERPKKTKKK